MGVIPWHNILMGGQPSRPPELWLGCDKGVDEPNSMEAESGQAPNPQNSSVLSLMAASALEWPKRAGMG